MSRYDIRYTWAMAMCSACGAEFVQNTGRGRKARFCGTACRMRAYRARRMPREMTRGRRWVAADGKRPIRPDGRPASTTDPATWSDYADVRDMPHGVMLGGGLGCYDMDHVTDEQARTFARTIPEPVVFVERSISGNGVHIFVQAPESRGWRKSVNGISVERYTRARFIRVTGHALKL